MGCVGLRVGLIGRYEIISKFCFVLFDDDGGVMCGCDVDGLLWLVSVWVYRCNGGM